MTTEQKLIEIELQIYKLKQERDYLLSTIKNERETKNITKKIIDEDLSVQTYNSLTRFYNDYEKQKYGKCNFDFENKTVFDLPKLSKNKLLSTRGLGITAVFEIERMLEKYGLKFE
jgi:DNA-directed RNA polymerase alpha subunit